MWTPSADFTYGVGAGLGVWFAFEVLRCLREWVGRDQRALPTHYQAPTRNEYELPRASIHHYSLPLPTAPEQQPGMYSPTGMNN